MATTPTATRSIPVRFVSSDGTRADYYAYVRRLARDVRVYRDIPSNSLTMRSTDVTPDEAAACIAAVRQWLADEHASFLVWAAKHGIEVAS